MSTQSDYIAAIDSLVKGDHPLVSADKILAISAAMKKYSKDKPRKVVEDESGTGAFDYAISLLADWADDFSTIREVEYPVDDDDETPDVLDEEQWMIYEKPAGKYLRFLDEKPATTETIRVTYTALHTCTVTACTVPSIDEDAVKSLCAAQFCEALAGYYSQDQDSTIDADSVDHTSKARDYASRAKQLRKIYNDHVGAKDGKPTPACHVQDQDVNYPGGLNRITHPGRYR
jgi:hypothetical protein